WRMSGDDALLHVLPVFHVHGLFVALPTAFLRAARVLWHDGLSPAEANAARADAAVMMRGPTHYTRMLEAGGLPPAACRSMRVFISGSAPLLAATHRRFEAATGHRILERYGMTECGMIASNPYDGDRVPGTVGFPLPGVSARVA